MSNGIFYLLTYRLSNKLKYESIFRAKFDMRYQTWTMSHEHVTWCKIYTVNIKDINRFDEKN